jgi:hypothetical protein
MAQLCAVAAVANASAAAAITICFIGLYSLKVSVGSESIRIHNVDNLSALYQ